MDKKKLITFILLIGFTMPSFASGSGRCQYRTDIAADGSLCGERSSEARSGSGGSRIPLSVLEEAARKEAEAQAFKEHFQKKVRDDNLNCEQQIELFNFVQGEITRQSGKIFWEDISKYVQVPSFEQCAPKKKKGKPIQENKELFFLLSIIPLIFLKEVFKILIKITGSHADTITGALALSILVVLLQIFNLFGIAIFIAGIAWNFLK